MLSQRLLDFLEDWCGMDSDPEDAAEMLRGPDGPYYLPWLPGELAVAIREHAITPELMSNMVMLHFEDQEEIDRWLRQCWQTWFTQPYPG
jgi:hypothetical protein